MSGLNRKIRIYMSTPLFVLVGMVSIFMYIVPFGLFIMPLDNPVRGLAAIAATLLVFPYFSVWGWFLERSGLLDYLLPRLSK